MACDWIRQGWNTPWTFWVNSLRSESCAERGLFLSDCIQILNLGSLYSPQWSTKKFLKKKCFFLVKFLFQHFREMYWFLLDFLTVSLYKINQSGIQNSDFSDLHDKKELELHIWRMWSTNQYYNLVQYYPITPSHLRKIRLLIFWWSDDL